LNYWDTSTLLKLYVAEQDSSYFINLIATSKEAILTSELTRIELITSLYRKESTGELAKGMANQHLEEFVEDIEAGRIIVISVREDVTSQAERVVQRAYPTAKPIMIRALDVIHVASALASKASVMVATDARLREVALLMGLKVLP
jgi:predicted nucleic acid-binding protein